MATAYEEEEAEIAKRSGQVIFAGSSNWSLTGRGADSARFDGVKDLNLLGFHRVNALIGINIRKVISGPTSCMCMAISDTGDLYVWGRNEEYQLGLKDTRNRYNPVLLSLDEGVKAVDGACGSNHTLVISDSGSLYSFGADKCGQCGLGRKHGNVKSPSLVQAISEVVTVAGGKDFSVAATKSGTLYTWGSPEYGQLGNGTDGKTLERSNKFTFDYVVSPKEVEAMDQFPDAKIVQVACGTNHTAARDSEGRIYTWGFGGYGRLGHKDNKDQYEPKAVEMFSFEPPPPREDIPKFMQRSAPKIRSTNITCGAISTFAIIGFPFYHTYMWGITKRSGEANMHPMTVDDVLRLRIRSISSGNSSTICCAGEELVTWGASPAYGELGYGPNEPKSSTKAKYVDDLMGATTLNVAMGYGHSLAVVDVSTKESKEIVEKLPVFAPEEVDPSAVPEPASKKGKKKAPAKGKKRKSKADAAAADDAEGSDKKAKA